MVSWAIILKKFEEREGANKILAKIRLIESPYKDSEYNWDADNIAMENRASEDKIRNRIAVRRVKSQLEMGRQVLMCTSRKYHACRLAKHFMNNGYRVGLILGTINKKKDISSYATPELKELMEKHDSKTDYERCKELAEKRTRYHNFYLPKSRYRYVHQYVRLPFLHSYVDR